MHVVGVLLFTPFFSCPFRSDRMTVSHFLRIAHSARRNKQTRFDNKRGTSSWSLSRRRGCQIMSAREQKRTMPPNGHRNA